jgi:hypothetical protein
MAEIIKSGPLVIHDIRDALPFPAGSVGQVVGNNVPSPLAVPEVATNAFEVLAPGGQIRIGSRSGGGNLWLEHLLNAGFEDVHIEGAHAVGTRPQ